jgi:serine/threonine protein kinase
MINENPAEAFELFLRAKELPELEWKGFLEGYSPRVREEVLSLLSHDRAPHPLVLGFDDPVEWSRAWSPDRIGSYEIAGRIGEGASGVVFDAVEPALGRRVAIKALLPGRLSSSTLRRFEREARALALLEHPGIARILRVGTAHEGRFAFPYITMELVDGLPLTRFVLQNDLDRPARLELMAKVCDAVQHAHQKGIVHRDLKPSNILVEAGGMPRILDFGIARLIHDEQGDHATLTGEVLGTPPYISPEQARADWHRIDTRSDIYSLGVLLLEVLTGARPSPHPTASGSFARSTGALAIPGSLRGDLEAVLRKATAAQPEHRYANASDLADELRRAARREPVLARRSSPWKRFTSYLRRHKALSIAVIAVTAGASIALWQAHRANDNALLANENAQRASKNAQRASENAQRANENYETLRDVLLNFCVEPGAPLLDDQKRVELLNRIRHLDLGGSEEEASVLVNIGSLMNTKGDQPHAITKELLDRAVAILEEKLGANHPKTLRARLELGWSAYRARRFTEAEAVARDVSNRLQGDKLHEQLYANAQLALGYSLERQGRYAETIPVLRSVAEGHTTNRLGALNRLGAALMNTGHPDQAIVCFRTVDRVLRESCTEPGQFIYNLRNLADYALRVDGDLEQARRLLNEAAQCAAKYDELPDEDSHPAPIGLAGLAWLAGDLSLCESILKDFLARTPRTITPESTDTLEPRNMLGVCLRDQRRWSEAEPILRAVLKERTEKLGPNAPAVSNSMLNLAQLLVYTGRPDEALDLTARASTIRLASFGPNSPEVLECRAVRGETLVSLGKADEGLELLRSMLRDRGPLADGDWSPDATAVPYAWSLARLGRKDEAEKFLADELELAKTRLGPKHLVTIRRQVRLDRFRDGTSPLLATPAAAVPAAQDP